MGMPLPRNCTARYHVVTDHHQILDKFSNFLVSHKLLSLDG